MVGCHSRFSHSSRTTSKLFLPLCAILGAKSHFPTPLSQFFLWKRPLCRHGISLQPLQAQPQPGESQTQLPNPKQNSQQKSIPSLPKQINTSHGIYRNIPKILPRPSRRGRRFLSKKKNK
uniref:Uncharacterized protein n=1 Tax=Geospiza parvula TaxID=87175 RepID=A0A8C3NC78_GEOPR